MTETTKPTLYAGQTAPPIPAAPLITSGMTANEVSGAVARGLAWVDPHLLLDNPFNPRGLEAYADEAEIKALGISIADNGMPQDPTVYAVEQDGEWVWHIGKGHRRTRAVISLDGDAEREYGYMLVRVEEPGDPVAMITSAALENAGKPLTPLEWANVYLRLEAFGQTQEQIGRKFGLSQGAVSNAIRLTKLPPSVREYINAGALSASHGTLLLQLSAKSAQAAFAQQAVEERLSTRQLDELIKNYVHQAQVRNSPRLVDDPGAAPKAGETPGVVLDDPPANDELSICRECQRTDAQVEREGERMFEPTLCEPCHDRERYREHTRSPANSPETGPESPENASGTQTTREGVSTSQNATEAQKPQGGDSAARTEADIEYCARAGLDMAAAFALLVRLIDVARAQEETVYDVLERLEAGVSDAKWLQERDGEAQPDPAGPASAPPILRQWEALKAGHPDALMMIRQGDFYELFNDDAAIAARELGLVLTSKGGLSMAGIPAHALERYVAFLADKGFRCAISEQGSGRRKREVSRVVEARDVQGEYEEAARRG